MKRAASVIVRVCRNMQRTLAIKICFLIQQAY